MTANVLQDTKRAYTFILKYRPSHLVYISETYTIFLGSTTSSSTKRTHTISHVHMSMQMLFKYVLQAFLEQSSCMITLLYMFSISTDFSQTVLNLWNKYCRSGHKAASILRATSSSPKYSAFSFLFHRYSLGSFKHRYTFMVYCRYLVTQASLR